jgi:hypothetical protein
MIDAYQAGRPGNGKPFPDRAKMQPTVPGTQHDVDAMGSRPAPNKVALVVSSVEEKAKRAGLLETLQTLVGLPGLEPGTRPL